MSSQQRAVRPTAMPAPAAWDLLGDLSAFRGGQGMVPVFAAVPLVPRASLHAHLDELWGVNGDLCAYGGGAFLAGGFDGIVTTQPRFGSFSWAPGRSPSGSPLRASGPPVTSQRLFPGVRGLLAGSGTARAADDMAALAWQLGAGAAAGGAAARDDGDGFGFATAASPLAAMLTELDNKERDVVERLSALLQADELLPPATKLAAVAASRAQFAAVREKILGAASMQVADADGDVGAHNGLGSALCAAGVDDYAAAADKADAKADEDEDERRDGLAPAGAADSDQEGSAEPGRRTRPQRKAAAGNPSYNERVAAARAALDEEDDTPLGSAATKTLRDWLFDHFLHPYPSDVEKTALAKRTGLKRSQVANWFINARVRVWRPAIFSMCAEMEQTQPAAAAASGSAARGL